MMPAERGRWMAIDWALAKDALARAEAAPDEAADGLALRHWRRIVALKSLATPLPHDEAARIPLHVLPPNRIRLVNPIQELQAVLTRGEVALGMNEVWPASVANTL